MPIVQVLQDMLKHYEEGQAKEQREREAAIDDLLRQLFDQGAWQPGDDEVP